MAASTDLAGAASQLGVEIEYFGRGAFDIFLNKRNLEELRAYFNGIRSLKKRVDPKWEPAFGSMFHPQTSKKSKGIPDEPEEG